MKNHSILFCVCLIIASFPLQAQYRSIVDDLEKTKSGEGKVKIIQDESLQTLLIRETDELSRIKGINGFRIRIFSGSGPNAKAEFEETKAQFISYYDVPLYERWDSPFYKIYVGDFRTRSEAMKLLNQIERRFPDAFIVQTKIYFPKIEPNE